MKKRLVVVLIYLGHSMSEMEDEDKLKISIACRWQEEALVVAWQEFPADTATTAIFIRDSSRLTNFILSDTTATYKTEPWRGVFVFQLWLSDSYPESCMARSWNRRFAYCGDDPRAPGASFECGKAFERDPFFWWTKYYHENGDTSKPFWCDQTSDGSLPDGSVCICLTFDVGPPFFVLKSAISLF